VLATLSDRELEIIRLLGKGFTTGEVARELGISGKTVESHRGNLRRKLNLGSGSELLRFALAYAEERI
jgi:DNA-binding CsgD family transcriptional regulator